MAKKSTIVVLKFGSSVLRGEEDLPTVVHEIYRWWRDGAQVIAVVSAFGDTTDELMRRAEKICAHPCQSVLPSLLATGESTSAALLALALKKAGIAARLLDEVQAKLRTVSGSTDAVPVAVDVPRLVRESERAVVVLPGFVGRDESGDRTVLGRGGSDLTALFLAHQLQARCVLIKDVDGLYTSDPALSVSPMSRFTHASYDTAIRLGGRVVQTKAARFAAANKVHFSITSIGAQDETEVGPVADRLGVVDSPLEPLRVALLGCGTVGEGVFERIKAFPNLFTLTGVGTRTGQRARAASVPDRLITSDLEGLIEGPCDVVIELIGGVNRAGSLIEQSLRLGRAVVTANKALVAQSCDLFERLAHENKSTFKYSAAVGGCMPAIETVRRARERGPLRSIRGVLNGTCNFVIDQIATGSSFDDAVREAQRAGYAEANPGLDLDGIDAAQKLVLLARVAFNINLPLRSISLEGIRALNSEAIRSAHERGRTVRLVAECRQTSAGLVEASVRPIELTFDHPLAQVQGVENRLVVEPEVGEPIVTSGAGAGRWPTTEAVVADLLDVVGAHSARDVRLEACA
ncbi:MAG TPA: homoserine dehydrogenase [Pyrinomonadaceae bacterium]